MEIIKARVTEGGRVVIPAQMRKALGIEVGQDVNFSLEENSVKISTPRQALEHLRELVRGSVPEGVSIVDELIADRRREAADE